MEKEGDKRGRTPSSASARKTPRKTPGKKVCTEGKLSPLFNPFPTDTVLTPFPLTLLNPDTVLTPSLLKLF